MRGERIKLEKGLNSEAEGLATLCFDNTLYHHECIILLSKDKVFAMSARSYLVISALLSDLIAYLSALSTSLFSKRAVDACPIVFALVVPSAGDTVSPSHLGPLHHVLQVPGSMST